MIRFFCNVEAFNACNRFSNHSRINRELESCTGPHQFNSHFIFAVASADTGSCPGKRAESDGAGLDMLQNNIKGPNFEVGLQNSNDD